MKQIDFERAIKRHCVERKAECPQCDLRLYCYTPPCERNDSLVKSVIQFFEQDNDRYVALEHSLECPMKMDFRGAVGYEESMLSDSTKSIE